MSLQRTKRETTSSEYAKWLSFLEMEDWHKTTKTEWYLANIATEIRRSYVKKPGSVKLKNFLLKFTKQDSVSSSRLTPEERLARSKAAWGAALGMKLE
jgi:hypothetical protein